MLIFLAIIINTLNELLCKFLLTQDFINLMASYSYKKLICMPTRVINGSSSLLDNIYTNLPNVYETGQSAHTSIFDLPMICLFLL